MNNSRHLQLMLMMFLFALGGCSTPTTVREGARLSAEQLTTFKSTWNKYIDYSNQDVALRSDRIKQRLERQRRLPQSTDIALYVGLANSWAMKHSFHELAAIAAQMEQSDAESAEALRLLSTRLATSNQKLSTSKSTFETLEQGIAKLADEDDFEAQFAFFVAYIDDVQQGLQTHLKAEKARLNKEKQEAERSEQPKQENP